MFVMTSDITIGGYTAIKPAGVKWKCSVTGYVDTCTISLPLAVYLKNDASNSELLKKAQTGVTGVVFNVGDAVDVKLGYDDNNTRRFKGFIKRINYATPLELECEGYSYRLSKTMFTKSYQATTAKAILADLVTGTDIKLSEAIPDMPLRNVTFKNSPGLKVLEWFQKECLLAVYFDFDTLYVGPSKYGVKKATEKLRLGWNTAEDKELKQSTDKTEVLINLVEKNSAGETKRTKSEQTKYSQTKEVKVRTGLDDGILKAIANELQENENFKGYKGAVTCFLEPHFEKGMVANITDNRFPERAGKYFVEEIDGSFDQSGGRQKLTLIYYGNNS